MKIYNSWKHKQRYNILLDIQSELTVLGHCLFGIEIVIWYKPFGYDLYFGLFGFSVTSDD